MLLLIDIGNTNIVVGCYENEKITQEARLATDALKTSDQYCMDLKNLLALYEIQREAVTGVIISSVVPPVLNSVRTAVMKLTGKKPLVVGPGIKTGLNILLDNPASVGSDLVVGAVAALHEYEPPLIMIDMGTATTIAVVDKNGAYIGGSICTGVKVATEALAGRAAQLPGISLDMPKKAIGRNTIDAMRSGIMLGNACMIDGMIERIEEELGQKATVVATAASRGSSSRCAAARSSTTAICCSRVLSFSTRTTGATTDERRGIPAGADAPAGGKTHRDAVLRV